MFVVTLPASASKDPKAFTLKAKRAGADILEIRGDLTPRIKPFNSPLPLLLAPRGHAMPMFEPSYIDFEFSELPPRREDSNTSKLIVSFHDYTKTPSLSFLKRKVEKMGIKNPWAVKIATLVRTYKELEILFALQDWLKEKHIRSIVLGMGEKAHLNRVISPLRNACTYASLDGEVRSADGQLPLSFYKLIKNKKNPKIFGILGGPHITASKSPLIHNALLSRYKIDAVYSSFPSENFSSAIQSLEKIGIHGLSVTAPFKYDAYKISKVKDDSVQSLRVANTLMRSGNAWSGFNTDWYGIFAGYPELKTAKALAILGAGGAVPSAILAARKANPTVKISVFARDPKKAEASLSRLNVTVQKMSASRLQSADIVICAVSKDVTLSFPNPSSKKSIAIDLRYGKTTKFLAAAKKAGYRTSDGTSMLIHQALKQFTHFTGKQPHKSDAAYLQKLLI